MGLAAPTGSDPVAAEVNGDAIRTESQVTEASQTASEYVPLSDIAVAEGALYLTCVR